MNLLQLAWTDNVPIRTLVIEGVGAAPYVVESSDVRVKCRPAKRPRYGSL